MVDQSRQQTARDRLDISLDEEQDFYRTWEASNKMLWDAILMFKARTCRELKRTRQQLQRALEEKDEAIAELVRLRRQLDRIGIDGGWKVR